MHFPRSTTATITSVLHPQARQRAYFMLPQVRSAALEGCAELMPLDHLGALRPAAAAGGSGDRQVSPPDADGNMSPRLNYDFLPAVWHNARIGSPGINPAACRGRAVSFSIKAAECGFHL